MPDSPCQPDPGLSSETGQLVIYLQRGFREPFLNFFNSVHVGQAACGTALKSCVRVLVPDIVNSPIFSKTDVLETMLDAGVRVVQSTPMVGRSGRILGMLSTHSRTTNYPGKKDLPLLDYLADWGRGSPRGGWPRLSFVAQAFDPKRQWTRIASAALLVRVCIMVVTPHRKA